MDTSPGDPLISPSLLAADSGGFSEAIACVERAGAECLHIDVMDGHFVPNLSFGPNILSGLRSRSRLFFDVHLMVEHPMRFAPAFIDAGADGITVHAESEDDIAAVVSLCRERGVDFGLALKPDTPLEAAGPYLPECDILLIMSVYPGFGGQKFMPSSLERIRRAREGRERIGAGYRISVDGGVDLETGPRCVLAGADMLVAGSAVFHSENPAGAVAALRGKGRNE